MSDAKPGLRRILSLWQLTLYGLGVIVGAGIYVAIGAVIERAGEAAPWSFLIAGLAAGLTGLCYAELGGRFPDAAGAAAYVMQGFGAKRLAQLVGGAMIAAIIISAAAILRGATSFLVVIVPLPPVLLTLAGGILFTAIAAIGVRETVGIAALLGAIEIAGLVAVIVAGFVAAPDYRLSGMLPLSLDAWNGVIAGAFIAFFAFLGFESLANMAEETRAPHRDLPRAILAAIALSVLLYVLVAGAVVLADRGGGDALIGLFTHDDAPVFAAFASLSVGNGALIEIVMLARLSYGMAHNAQLPAALAVIDPRTHTPLLATLLAGAAVTAAAVLAPFEGLLVLTNALTLGVFVMVDLALWRVQRSAPQRHAGFTVPRWVPPAAAAVALVLMLAELIF